jgi:hypothetical protein
MKKRGQPREMARTTAKRVKKWNVPPAEQNYRTEAKTVQKGRSTDGDQNVRSTSEVRKRFYFWQITLISGSDYRPIYIVKGTISTVRYCMTGGTKKVMVWWCAGVSSLSHTLNICGEIIRRRRRHFAQVQSGSLRIGTGGRLLWMG